MASQRRSSRSFGKKREAREVKDVERAFKSLAECLKGNGYNLATFMVEDINDKVVGDVYTYLEQRKFANRTFNKYFSHYTSFMRWYAEEYDCPIRNCFEKVRRKNLNPKPEAITRKEYEELLKQITLENGIKEYKDGVKPVRIYTVPGLQMLFV